MAFNQAKMTGDWESYKIALICYKKGQMVLLEGLLPGDWGGTRQRQPHDNHSQSVSQQGEIY